VGLVQTMEPPVEAIGTVKRAAMVLMMLGVTGMKLEFLRERII
jgi:hypothetical protein